MNRIAAHFGPVTTDGLPLGMAAAKFWTRKKFKGTNALKRRQRGISPTIIENLRTPPDARTLDGFLEKAGDGAA